MGETYKRWRLPQLWEMVAADDEADAHVHLATLRRQQTALETQRDRLRILRDQLAEGWPPEKSEAATVFVQRLNDMIRAMSQTAIGAADVRTNLSLIVDAMHEARTQLDSLMQEFQKTASFPDPRARQHARTVLDERARRVLIAADEAVVEPTGGLDVALPTYQRIDLQAEIPPPLVAPGGPGVGRPAAGGGGSGLGPLRFDPPEPIVGPSQDGTVVLTGGSSDAVGRGPAVVLPGVVDGTQSLGSAGSAFGPGRVPGAVPVMRPGVQGENGAANGGQLRGVIGGSSGEARANRAPLTSPIGRAGGHRDTSSEGYADRRSSSQGRGEAWSVPSGVAPVIEPPEVRRHESGPGVLGIDR
ncbi:hypothetical protein [Dactylosporangium maewongense]